MRPIPLPVRKIRELDRRAAADYEMPVLILMENAGRSLADILERNLIPPIASCRVIFVCGGGNNGGDGFVAARHLHHKGVPTEVFLTADPAELKAEAAVNFRIISKIGVPCYPLARFAERQREWDRKPVVLVDAVLGTGVRPPLKPAALDAIRRMNQFKEEHSSSVKLVAVDIPSGMDGDAGALGPDVVKADLTVTFACQKLAFANPANRVYVGRVDCVDIGIPPALVQAVAESK